MKKSKKVKKDDIVEISKSAFKNARQTGKSISQVEVIRKVVDSVDDTEKEEVNAPGEEGVVDRNPDTESADERMESIETLTEAPVTSEEDAIQIYRDVMAMTEDDKNDDGDGKLSPLRLSPPPPPSWSDFDKNVKFKIGEFVRYRGNPKGKIYKVCGPAKEKDTYSIKGSCSRDSYTEAGDKLIKVTDKNVDWVDYWKMNPVIPAPKPWLKKK